MAENFMTGFAQGFIRARERSEDRRHDQEQLMFKYKMDALMDQRELRRKKQQKEREWKTQAESLAQIQGDPDFAQTAISELSNGVSYETLQKRIAEGAYATNDTYVVPNQTVKVPNAVSQPSKIPNVIDEQGDAGYVDPLVSAPNSKKSVFGFGKEAREERMRSRVDEKINQIDPTLLAEDAQDEGYSSTTKEGTNSKYIYKPKNEVKLGSYDEAVWKLMRAQESGDPKAISEAQMAVEAHERALTTKAKIEARSKGEDVRTYVSLDESGKMGKQFPGVVRDGKLWNIADPRSVESGGAEVTGPIIEMSEEQWKRLNKLRDDFGKDKSNYDIQASSLVSAMDSSQKLTQLLAEDPNAGSSTYKGIAVVERLGRELGAIHQAVSDLQVQIDSSAGSGDTGAIGGLVRNLETETKKLEQAALLGDANQKKIINAALYNSYRISAAYQFAQAAAGDGKMSNQDFENALARIGGNGNLSPAATAQALNAAAQEAFIKVEGLRRNLETNPSINGFEQELFGESRGQTGLKPERLGEMILRSTNDPDRQKMLMQFLGNLDNTYKTGQDQTRQSIQPQIDTELNIPKAAIDYLKNNPELKDAFDKKYGAGAADRVLGE